MNRLMKTVITAAIILIIAVPGFSEDGDNEAGWGVVLSGYYKNIFQYQRTDNFYREPISPPERRDLISDMNRLRLAPEMNYGEILSLHADLDLKAVMSNYNRTSEFDARWKEPYNNEVISLSHELTDSNRIWSEAEARNFYVKMVIGRFTGTIGRQQIRFGNSRLWNPLDIMVPLNPVSIEGADSLKGIDAVRLDWYPGESTELTGVLSARDREEGSRSAGSGGGNFIVRIKSGIDRVDLALLSGYISRRKNFGTDFVADVNDGLLTGAFLYSVPDSGESFYQCGTGYEYTFRGGIYILVEYFYNSLPVNESRELRDAIAFYMLSGSYRYLPEILSNRIITFNSHYLSFAAGYDFFPLLRGEVFSIYDFQGRGLFTNCLLKLNAAQNIDITLGVISAYTGESDRDSDFKDYNMDPVYYAMLQFYF